MAVISVVVPVVRPASAAICAETIMNCNCPQPHTLEVLLEEDTEGIGCPRMVKQIVRHSHGEFIAFIGDDCKPQEEWLHEAMIAMSKLPDGWGLVGLNDGTGRELPTHWVAHRRLLPYLDGEFFHTGYTHCYCDNELWDRCKVMGKYTFAEKAKVKHNNPFLDSRIPFDEYYAKAYKPEITAKDKALYERRKANGWM